MSGTPQTGVKFHRLSDLRKLRDSEQVAAVCYRINGRGIEFLLVKTGGGRWTFPKGSAEAGLTHAQAAALEAFEEAGVHGRMEETSFASYVRPRRERKRRSKAAGNMLAVHAHLCEVSRRQSPQEQKRKPTWFPAAQAKRRLQEDRIPQEGSELARVVDRAVARIQNLHHEANSFNERGVESLTKPDALQRVQLEASPGARYSAAIELALHAQFCDVMQAGPEGSQEDSLRFSAVRSKRTLRRVPVDQADFARVVGRFLANVPRGKELPDKRNGVVIEIDKKLSP